MAQCIDGWMVYPQDNYTDFVRDNQILRMHDDGRTEAGCLNNGGIPAPVQEAPVSPPMDLSWLSSLVEYWSVPQGVVPTPVFQDAPAPVPFPVFEDVPQAPVSPPSTITVGEPYPPQDPIVEDYIPPYTLPYVPSEDPHLSPPYVETFPVEDIRDITFPYVKDTDVPVMAYPTKEDPTEVISPISPITPTNFFKPVIPQQPFVPPTSIASKPVVPKTVATTSFPKVGSFIPQNSVPAPFAPVGSVVGYPTVDTFNPYTSGWTFASGNPYGQPGFNVGQLGLLNNY